MVIKIVDKAVRVPRALVLPYGKGSIGLFLPRHAEYKIQYCKHLMIHHILIECIILIAYLYPIQRSFKACYLVQYQRHVLLPRGYQRRNVRKAAVSAARAISVVTEKL